MTLTEADTRAKLIDPLLKQAWWDEENILREYKLNQPKYVVLEEEAFPQDSNLKILDYLLVKNDLPLAVVEAKKESEDVSKHTQQLKEYVQLVWTKVGFITNWKIILKYDQILDKIEPVDKFPSPNELLQYNYNIENFEKNPLLIPFYKAGGRVPRYYQVNAVTKAIENILKWKKQTLLVLATGAWKTFISSQIVWKLFQSGFYNKILFLTDRKLLRDQAFNDFTVFEDKRYKIKNQQFNQNRNIYFATYQTLFNETNWKRFFQTIDKDFFDLIIIDECHRSRYGTWWDILDYFWKAHHLGLTATPQRTDNKDVFDYFWQPVYQYSLWNAINDGFLSTFKIYKLSLNIFEKWIDLKKQKIDILNADELDETEIQALNEKEIIDPKEIDRKIVIQEGTSLMAEETLNIISNKYKSGEKTVVFCVDQEHAQRFADEISFLAKQRGFDNSFWVKIVSEDTEFLESFKSINQPYPVVATTVDLLSTWVDIPSIKNVVFARFIGSPTLFKQIIWRGSRLWKDKWFFRIIDFTNATRFLDDWDFPNEKWESTWNWPTNPKPPFDSILIWKVEDEDWKALEQVKVKIKLWKNILFDAYTDKAGYFTAYNMPSNEKFKIILSKEWYFTYVWNIKNQKEEQIFTLRTQKIKHKLKIAWVEVYKEKEIILEIDWKKLSYAEYKKNYFPNKLKENLQNQKILKLDDLKTLWKDFSKREELLDYLKNNFVYVDFVQQMEDLTEYDKFDIIAWVVFETTMLTRSDRVKAFLYRYENKIKETSKDLFDVVNIILERYERFGEEELTPSLFSYQEFAPKKMAIKKVYWNLFDFFHNLADNIYFKWSWN